MAASEYPKVITEDSGFDTYGVMLVSLSKCPICGKHMIAPHGDRSPFPSHFDNCFSAQVSRAGWELESSETADGYNICQSCSRAGLATFECALCGNKMHTGLVQESFGDPSEYLCKKCYSTVPAQEWERAVDKLERDHRYDFSG